MSNVIRVENFAGALLEKRESRDCWYCVHIEKDDEWIMQPVCVACKWNGAAKAGTDDNYIQRPDGRWNGVEMLKRRRFIKTTSEAGVSFIKDTRDDSIVCIMQRAKRPPEHTEAMLRVMLDALNDAVEAKNGCAGQSAQDRA